MDDHILPALKQGCYDFWKLIDSLYDGQLRNDFAHASYYIDLQNNDIISLDSERYFIKKKTNLFDWEEIFIYSLLLSYYLPIIIRDRRNSFLKDYPDKNYVMIDWPSYKHSGETHRTPIYPIEREGEIEFNFVE